MTTLSILANACLNSYTSLFFPLYYPQNGLIHMIYNENYSINIVLLLFVTIARGSEEELLVLIRCVIPNRF